MALSMKRERQMLANFDRELRCSRPGGNGDLEPRRDIACVVCARKDWLENRFPVDLWRRCPEKTRSTKDAVVEPLEVESEDSEGDSDNDSGKPPCKLLRSPSGVYHLGDAAKVITWHMWQAFVIENALALQSVRLGLELQSHGPPVLHRIVGSNLICQLFRDMLLCLKSIET